MMCSLLYFTFIFLWRIENQFSEGLYAVFTVYAVNMLYRAGYKIKYTT